MKGRIEYIIVLFCLLYVWESIGERLEIKKIHRRRGKW